MGVTPPPVTSQRETVHLPLHPLCTPPPFLPTCMLRLQRCLCHSTAMPWRHSGTWLSASSRSKKLIATRNTTM